MTVKFKYNKNDIVYYIVNLLGGEVSAIHKGRIARMYWWSNWVGESAKWGENIPVYGIKLSQGSFVTILEPDIHRSYLSAIRYAKEKRIPIVRKVIKGPL